MSIFSIAQSFYNAVPRPFQRLFDPGKAAYRASIRIMNRLRTDCWVLSQGDPSKSALTVFFAGGVEHKNYFARFTLEDTRDELFVGRRWQWNAIHSARAGFGGASLVILETHKSLGRLLSRTGGFFIPSWLGGDVDISGDFASVVRTKAQLKSDSRKVRVNQLSFEVTKDPAHYELFYEKMYLPHTRRAHGDSALLVGYEAIKQKMHQTELLLIRKGSEYIGGVILLLEEEPPQIWCIGIKDGNPEYINAGAMAANWYFPMEYLNQLGFGRLHLGGSRAFFKDGVFRFKVRRGMRLMPPRKVKSGFFLKPLSMSDGVKSFLIQNPFIHAKEEALIGACFVESDAAGSEEDIQRICHEHFLRGLDRLEIYMFGGGETAGTKLIPDELRQKVSVLPAERLFRNP